MKQYLFLLKSLFFVSTVLLILAVFSFRPAPNLANCNSKQISAKIINVYAEGDDYLVFELQGIRGKFYIHKIENNSLSAVKAQDLLLDQEVTIVYPTYWTIYDPFSSTRPIFKMTYQHEIIYVET